MSGVAWTIQGRPRSVRGDACRHDQPEQDQLDAEQQQRDHDDHYDDNSDEREHAPAKLVYAPKIGNREEMMSRGVLCTNAICVR
jgi:hypothetical protein